MSRIARAAFSQHRAVQYGMTRWEHAYHDGYSWSVEMAGTTALVVVLGPKKHIVMRIIFRS